MAASFCSVAPPPRQTDAGAAAAMGDSKQPSPASPLLRRRSESTRSHRVRWLKAMAERNTPLRRVQALEPRISRADEILKRTLEVWGNRSARPLNMEDARQIAENATGFSES